MTKKTLLSLFMVFAMIVSFAVPAMASTATETKYKIKTSYDEDRGYVNPYKSKATKGTEILFEVETAEGFEVDDVFVMAGETEVTYEYDDGFYSFIMPESDVTIEATFQLASGYYAINLDFNDNNGWVQLLTDSYAAKRGERVEFEVDPDDPSAGYQLRVTDGDGDALTVKQTGGKHYFTMPASDVTITATFWGTGDYEIETLYDDDYGEVELSTYKADRDDIVEIYVYPESGYTVASVSVVRLSNGRGVAVTEEDDCYSFEMPAADVIVSVKFSGGDGDYMIDLEYDDECGEVDLSALSADENEAVRIYTAPEYGYAVKSVEVYEKTTGDEVDVTEYSTYFGFTMPADDVYVFVEFVESEGEYYIMLDYDDDEGSVETNKVYADEDETVKLYIDPDNGFTVYAVYVTSFSGEEIGVRAKAGYYQFTMPDDDVYVEVEFVPVDGDYLVALDYDDYYGDVDVDKLSADAGETVKIYIDPDGDFEIKRVKVTTDTGKNVTVTAKSSYYYFKMPSDDVTVTVTFQGESSSSSPTAGTKYDIDLFYNDTFGEAELSVDRAKEDTVVKVYVDCDIDDVDDIYVINETTGAEVYTRRTSDYFYFTMPASNVYVDVVFEDECYGDYLLGIDYNTRQGDVKASTTKVDKNTEVRVYVMPDDGYVIDSVKVIRASNNRAVTCEQYNDFVYIFTMPASDAEVVVTFKEEVVIKNYKASVAFDSTMGTASLSKTEAPAGTEITVTATPKTGYKLDSVKATIGDTTAAITVTEKNGVYAFAMPDGAAKVTVTFSKIPVEVVHICALTAFTDVDTKLWYHEALDYVVMNGLMNGMGDNIFAPDATVTRAMVVTVIWRRAGSPVSTSPIPYADVKAGEWYTEAVRWAAANGLLTNVTNGTSFEPNATITREQFADVIYRAEQYKAGGTIEKTEYQLNFSDLAQLSAWAYDSMNWCNKNGIISGMGEGILNPKGSTTRAQLAQILLNLGNYDAK